MAISSFWYAAVAELYEQWYFLQKHQYHSVIASFLTTWKHGSTMVYQNGGSWKTADFDYSSTLPTHIKWRGGITGEQKAFSTEDINMEHITIKLKNCNPLVWNSSNTFPWKWPEESMEYQIDLQNRLTIDQWPQLQLIQKYMEHSEKCMHVPHSVKARGAETSPLLVLQQKLLSLQM